MIIPEPKKKTIIQSRFYINKYYTFDVPKSRVNEKKYLLDFLDIFGITKGETSCGVIKFVESDTIRHDGYRLICQDHEIILTASSDEGFLYGMHSIVQIIHEMKFKSKTWINSFIIEDRPRYKWRGLMLDVADYYMSLESIKKIVNVMSVYKLNVLHLKLTGCNSWRVESKVYKKLNNASDDKYSIEELKDLIDYATKMHIHILPEITIPTETDFLVDVYPELSCKGDMDHKHLCLTDMNVKKRVKSLIKEVASLFPFEYIHLGAYDLGLQEITPCNKCQEKLIEWDTDDKFELVSRFMEDVIEFINTCGKKVMFMNDIGHDLHKSDQIVQFRKDIYFYGDEFKLLNEGAHVVNSNEEYFDFSESYIHKSLKKLYKFEPTNRRVKKENRSNLQGVEGMLWTKDIENEYEVFEMLFPRVFALSEIGWARKDKKSYPLFASKLYTAYDLILRLGVEHFTPLNAATPTRLRKVVSKIIN